MATIHGDDTIADDACADDGPMNDAADPVNELIYLEGGWKSDYKMKCRIILFF